MELPAMNFKIIVSRNQQNKIENFSTEIKKRNEIDALAINPSVNNN